MYLFKQYNKLAMHNMRLNKEEVSTLLDYKDDKTQRVSGTTETTDSESPLFATLTVIRAKPPGDVLAIMNAWNRESRSATTVNAGYLSLANMESEHVTLVGVESEALKKIEVHKVAKTEHLIEMRKAVGARDGYSANRNSPLRAWWQTLGVNGSARAPLLKGRRWT